MRLPLHFQYEHLRWQRRGKGWTRFNTFISDAERKNETSLHMRAHRPINMVSASRPVVLDGGGRGGEGKGKRGCWDHEVVVRFNISHDSGSKRIRVLFTGIPSGPYRRAVLDSSVLKKIICIFAPPLFLNLRLIFNSCGDACVNTSHSSWASSASLFWHHNTSRSSGTKFALISCILSVGYSTREILYWWRLIISCVSSIRRSRTEMVAVSSLLKSSHLGHPP